MSHRFGKAQVFAGIGVVLVLVAVIVGMFVLRMLPLSAGDAAAGRIAFVSGRDGDAEIYVMNADGSGVVQLTENDFFDSHPTWSQDGSRIAFVSDRDGYRDLHDIYVMNADGSGVERLMDDCSNVHISWSPDGDRIAYVSRGDIYVMNVDGSGVMQLTGEALESCAGVFWSDRDGDGVNEAYIRNADGSVEPFTDHDNLNWEAVDLFPTWSPDGGRIAFQSHRDGDWGIYVMNADGSGVERLTDNEHWDWLPSWSPDGSRIAFVSHRDGDWDIYVMDLDSSGFERLTENEYDDSAPAWSPDGGRIAFASERDGRWVIYAMNVDGSEVVRLGDGSMPAWSPVVD